MKNDKENLFGKNISIINRTSQGYFHHKLKRFGIGPGQQAYLLSLLPGEEIRQDELARRLKVDKANVTRAVKGLEGLGMLNKVRNREDARSWIISLTPLGVKTRSEIEVISIEWVNKLKEPLDDEEWTLLEKLLARIAGSF
jgi:DNA-binding MarR family transcriptional regulator